MNYAYITKNDMLNGEGLRVTLWVTGCPHHCDGCHNAWSWNPDEGKHFDHEAYLELINELKHDYIDGITFLGGEPLAPYNLDTVTSITKSSFSSLVAAIWKRIVSNSAPDTSFTKPFLINI